MFNVFLLFVVEDWIEGRLFSALFLLSLCSLLHPVPMCFQAFPRLGAALLHRPNHSSCAGQGSPWFWFPVCLLMWSQVISLSLVWNGNPRMGTLEGKLIYGLVLIYFKNYYYCWKACQSTSVRGLLCARPCERVNILYSYLITSSQNPSGRHSDYPSFCRWGNWGAEGHSAYKWQSLGWPQQPSLGSELRWQLCFTVKVTFSLLVGLSLSFWIQHSFGTFMSSLLCSGKSVGRFLDLK